MDGHERELGELRAEVRGLTAAFQDFRSETRRWQEQILERLGTRLDLHSRRLGTLERWRSAIIATLGLLAAGFAALLKGVLPFIWPRSGGTP